jgi:hypothetical protein
LLLIAGGSAGVALADSGHARIVRLSLVQGDVRFARDVKGDPLADSHGDWEEAVLNLPIRQGYVVATDNGRAAVEFENGAMAYLAENTVLEFYDLSSEDGGFTTRLILRQGSAEFYVNPGRSDYFSVTGGDFSVQAETRTTFRMNNFDDGSNVSVLRGRLTALTDGKNTPLQKGQSLSLQAGEPDALAVEHAPANDEFDQWASGQIDSASTATKAASQYANSDDYTSGYGDLYTYGSWFPVAGYGNCWRPYGVGFGWSPFDYGSWYYDSFFGWSFIGGQPWGWLPYHYGGWLFRPGVGWVWSPAGAVGGVGRWRPVTGVWMRSSTGVAIVPSHPLDVKGKPPLNLSSGLFAVTARGVSGQLSAENGEQWKVEKKPARDLLQNQLAAVTAPAHLSRTMAAAGATAGSRGARSDHDSTIVYDRTEKRCVNSNKSQPVVAENTNRTSAEQNRSENLKAQVPGTSDRPTGRENQTAQVPNARSTAPPRPAVVPPNVPRSVTTERAFHEGGASEGSRGGATAGGASSRSGSSTTSAPTPSPSSSSGARASSASSGSGGRPH